MLPGVLLGLGFGVGLLIALHGFVVRPEPLAQALARFEGPAGRPPSSSPLPAKTRLGLRLAGLLEQAGLDTGTAEADLNVTERTRPQQALEKLAAALASSAVPALAGLVLSVGGLQLSPVVIVGAVAAMFGLGSLVPDVTLRSAAQEARREIRHDLSAYLDLVVVIVSGGGGIETALYGAADAGTGRGFERVRSALSSCRLSRESPWVAFERLGTELGVEELRVLAANVGLAGEQGARVRQTLRAAAAALREQLLVKAEAEALAATEKMSVPVALMLFGFVGFVLYPALQFTVSGG